MDEASLSDRYELDIDRGMPTPWRKEPAGVAVLLHGGPGGPPAPKLTDISYNRMTTFRMHILTSLAGEVPVVQVYNRRRGWAERRGQGIQVATAVLDDVAERFPGLPLVLVGHSSGAYAALHVAGHPRVKGVVALAPYLETVREPVAQLAGRRVIVLHGGSDWVTSPRRSKTYVQRAQAAGHDVRFFNIRNGDHDMLRSPMQWHNLTTGHVKTCLGL